MSNWAHSPAHYFSEQGTYFITASTLYKYHLWNSTEKLDYLEELLFCLLDKYSVKIQAWVLLRNHYHVMVFAEGKNTVTNFLTEFHRVSATWLNNFDKTPARKVWYQYWDKQITFQKSYLARFKYIKASILDALRKFRSAQRVNKAAYVVRHQKVGFTAQVLYHKIRH